MDRETLIALIEQAARKSLPWPDVEHYLGEDENGEDIEGPPTLEHFVNGTYLYRNGADEVFRAAAEAAADAVLAACPSPEKA